MREYVVLRAVSVRVLLIGRLLMLFLFCSACPSGVARAAEVSDWNMIAINTTLATGKNPVLQSRIYAMTHAAIHDALNAIDRRYRPYTLEMQADPAASPAAAVAAAAYGVLVYELPTQQMALDVAYARGRAVRSGITAVSAQVLRRNDRRSCRASSPR